MTNFEKWVEKVYKEFSKDFYANVIDWETLFDKTVIVCYNKKTNKIGIARLHPDDKFDSKIGVVIAYARTKGYKVPKQTVYKKLSEMKNGDRFKWSNKKYIFIGENSLDKVIRETYVTINIHKYTHHEPNYYQTFYGDNNKYEMVD